MKLLSVFGANGKLRSAGVADITCLADRVGVRGEVGRVGPRSVASTARRCNRRRRVDVVLPVRDLILTVRQVLLARIDVAYRTGLRIRGRPRRAHGRIEHIAEVIDSSVVRDLDVACSHRGEVNAGVNSMDREVKVQRLGRLGQNRRILRLRASWRIGQRRIVAVHFQDVHVLRCGWSGSLGIQSSW